MTPEKIVATYFGSDKANEPLVKLIRDAVHEAYEDAAKIAEEYQWIKEGDIAAAIRARITQT